MIDHELEKRLAIIISIDYSIMPIPFKDFGNKNDSLIIMGLIETYYIIDQNGWKRWLNHFGIK